MKKSTIGLLALGMFLAACGSAAADTHTISWSPVTTYSDGTPISGATVTYSVYWSSSSSLSPATAISAMLTGTSTTFDPAAVGMTAGGTVYFAMKTVLSTGETSAFSSPVSWVVPTLAIVPTPTLSGIAISGVSSLDEGTMGVYTASAVWSDGATSAVAPTWGLSSTASATISGAGLLTAGSVSANQTVTVTASCTAGGVTRTASKAVTIVNVAPILAGIAINGPSSVNEGATGGYTATAVWSDGTTSAVAPRWGLSSTAYASISSAGVLTAASVSSNQTVVVNASYSGNGIAKSASKNVTIVNLDPAVPAAAGNLRIEKPETLPPDAWRIAWDAVTNSADGQPLGGASVRYAVYWTRDPSLAPASQVLLTASTAAACVDFQPLALGMTPKSKVYFTVRTVLGTGESSDLSAPLSWRVLNAELTAPAWGTIKKK